MLTEYLKAGLDYWWVDGDALYMCEFRVADRFPPAHWGMVDTAHFSTLDYVATKY